MTTRPTLTYLAGFFDGEGSICIVRRSQGGYILHVDAAQVAKAPLVALQERFGGSIQLQRRSGFGRQDVWYWKSAARTAGAALAALRPYLLVKRAQANLALEFQARRLQGFDRRRPEVIAAQYERDAQYAERMRAFNHPA